MLAFLAPAPFAAALALAGVTHGADVAAPRTERFVVERELDGVHVRAGTLVVRHRFVLGGVQRELEIELERDGNRAAQNVWVVERDDATHRELLWREVGPGSSRMCSGEVVDGGRTLAVREWTSDETLRAAFDLEPGASFFLEVLERARTGVLAAQSLVFDPRSRTFEVLAARTSTSSGRRTVELVRDDATLFARAVFDVDGLASLALHDGALVARRAPPPLAREHD